MDVAYVSNVVYPYVTGGAQKRIHEIGTRLAADGHTVTVYGRHFWDGPAEMTNAGMTLKGVSSGRDLYVGDRRSIPEAIEFAVAVLRPLRRAIDRHDLVVASVFPYFPIFSAKAATLFRTTPLVTTWHEVWGGYWDRYLGRLSPFGKAVEYAVARLPQYPIAVSSLTADRLAGLGQPRDRIEVVPNGIDFDRIRSVPPVEDGFDVVVAGRHIPEKNVDVVLRAFENIAADHDATLGIIGEGPETERLRALARSLESGDRITFTGFLDEYEDVLAHMHAADVFASASTREGFGIAALEAMAAGCTVLAADHPESAASEVIGDAGFCPAPTADAFATALDRALAGNRPSADPVAAARGYDWENVVSQAERAYRAAIETA
jgi:glycosyltransferase involved in cell wall biosynthesis